MSRVFYVTGGCTKEQDRYTSSPVTWPWYASKVKARVKRSRKLFGLGLSVGARRRRMEYALYFQLSLSCLGVPGCCFNIILDHRLCTTLNLQTAVTDRRSFTSDVHGEPAVTESSFAATRQTDNITGRYHNTSSLQWPFFPLLTSEKKSCQSLQNSIRPSPCR